MASRPIRLEDYGDVLQVKEVAAILGLSLNTTYEALRRGEIPSRKIGNQYRIAKVRLKALIEGDGPGEEME